MNAAKFLDTNMNWPAIILVVVLELAALILVVRLWVRRRHRLIPRILWSLFLLIPVFGLLMYGFLVSSGESNPDRIDSQADSDASAGWPLHGA